MDKTCSTCANHVMTGACFAIRKLVTLRNGVTGGEVPGFVIETPGEFGCNRWAAERLPAASGGTQDGESDYSGESDA